MLKILVILMVGYIIKEIILKITCQITKTIQKGSYYCLILYYLKALFLRFPASDIIKMAKL